MFKSIISATLLSLLSSAAFAGEYTVTVTNNMATELLAPILITDVENDGHIFHNNYVTAAAEQQILTGDPATLSKRISSNAMAGHRASVAHGTDGPPGVLLAPGKSLTFIINTEASAVRVLAMVAPTEFTDNYVTAIIDLTHDDMMETDSMASDDMASDSMAPDAMMMHGMAGETVSLDRFDIGHDEGTKMITSVSGLGGATISITANM